VYAHPGNRVAVLLEVNCESDFVAATDDFKGLVHQLALHIAFSNPRYIRLEDVPADVVEAQRTAFRAEAAASGKPEGVLDRIVQGKLDKFYDEVCLLRQPFVKDDKVKVGDLVTSAIAKIGENIVVRRFVRYELGEA
jgi:elongation factor Ts